MIKTRITEMLGIEYPIIGGTMMWISYGGFVAAISEAGGCGVLASAISQSKEEFRDEIQKVKSLTKKPFAVNLNMFPAMRPIDNKLYIEVLLEEGVKIIETSGHKAPEDLYPPLKEAGCTLIHKCVGARYAKKAVSVGADIVTVVGYENGGAVGNIGLGTFVLVPSVVDAVPVPVIGGGGVADGRGIAAMLALGAEGVIMGTRLLLTDECPIHDSLKAALAKAQETDTLVIMKSVNSAHRVWANEAGKKAFALDEKKAPLDELLKVVGGDKARILFAQGQLDAGIIATGQCIGLCSEILPLKELFKRIMAQAEQVLGDAGKA
jgi:NADH:quinone reductase (non-electrogenic)